MKTKKELLESYKRSNKQRRIKVWQKAGYACEAAYLTHLGVDVYIEEQLSKVKPIIHNVCILDKSGSMYGSKFDSALAGINQEINELKTDNQATFYQTTLLFSINVKLDESSYKVPIQSRSRITGYADGGTALYDAIGMILTRLIADYNSNERVLVKIFTDGEENSSYRFSKADIINLIDKAKSKGFTVTFVGTKFDTDVMIRDFKISASNTLVHDNTETGVKMSFRSSNIATKSYVQAVTDGASTEELLEGFYKREGTL